jgi:MFS family permease
MINRLAKIIFFGKVGPRTTFVVYLIGLTLMGVATVAIGLLPTYVSIGLAAPILLIVLRIAQGILFGGVMRPAYQRPASPFAAL